MDNLQRRRVIIVNACPMCLVGEEPVDHLMIYCSIAHHLWMSIFTWFHVHVSGPLPNSLPSLFEFWRLGAGSKRGRIMWKVSFLAAIWSI